jgi:cyclohexanecarboxylate-CoA ligase
VTRGPTLDLLLAGQATTIVDGERRITNISGLAARVAAGLHDQGVRRGDAVAFQLPNVAETVLLYRACWQLGAVAVALHHRFGIVERESLLTAVDPSLVILSAEEVRSLTRGPESYEASDARPDDDAVVLFTAGSTGEPKGVRHTHGALAYKARLMTEVHGLSSDDVVLMPAPLAHISGLLNGILVSGAAGMTTVLMGRWSPAVALDLIERENVSFMVGPPTFFVDLMEDPTFAPERVESLRLISSGGAGVARRFVKQAASAFGAVVKRSYGSTEAPTVATSTADDDPERARRHDGHAIGGVELEIVHGELWIRGPELFAGYLSNEQTAACVTADGWYRTGDLATIDDDGWLTITGRLKDIIIRAGENISIREVEETLEAHPNVIRAAVVGVAHERLGEQVAAVVQTNGESFTVADCLEWFAACGIAKFKTPEIVRNVRAVPLLPTGKVDRQRLAALV